MEPNKQIPFCNPSRTQTKKGPCVFLKDEQDLIWCEEIFCITIPDKEKNVVLLYGTEDCPDEIHVFPKNDVNTVPVIYNLVGWETGNHRWEKD